MVVAFNALSLHPGGWGGASTFTLNVLGALPEQLPEARVVVLARAAEKRIPASQTLEVRRFSVHGTAGRLAVESVLLARELRRLRADVFVSPNESLPLGFRGRSVVVAQNLAYHKTAPSTFAGRTWLDRAATRVQSAYYRRRMPRAFRTATAVVAVSAEAARVLVEHAGLSFAKTRVIWEGSDSFLLRDRLPGLVKDDVVARRLLIVSALAPYKNIATALEAMADIGETRPDVTLDVVGPDWRGYGSVLRERARALGVDGRVTFHGSVSPELLVEFYEASDLLLELSSCESFGLPLLEAMRYGLPVVAADASALPEVAGGAASLIPTGDRSALHERVLHLLADERERDRLRQLGFERSRLLTWRRCASELAAVIREVASTTGAGAPHAARSPFTRSSSEGS